MDEINASEPQIKSGEWPNCSFIRGACVLDQLEQALGPEIMASLLAFILEPQAGARLSLQRNQKEFTSQITGPVVRGAGAVVGLGEFQTQQRKFEGIGRITPDRNGS